MADSPIQVVCAVIERGRSVLACQRPASKHLGGLWEFPGGKVETNEDPVAALHREIFEELQVRIEILSPLSPVCWDYGSVSIFLRPYRCKIRSGTLHATEHNALRWCQPHELTNLPWAEADIPIVDEWRRAIH